MTATHWNRAPLVALVAAAALTLLLTGCANNGGAAAARGTAPTASATVASAGAPTAPATAAPAASPTTPASATPAPTSKPASRVKPGYIVGRVVDTHGKPIAGAHIDIWGVTQAGQNVNMSFRTQADGTYSVKMPDGQYETEAWFSKQYNGGQYHIDLAPSNNSTAEQDSRPGIVRDFTWRLTGHGPWTDSNPADPGAVYWGGWIRFWGVKPGDDTFELKTPPGSTLEVTLTPVGPLIDGSNGKTLVFKHQLAKSPLYNNPIKDREWLDIPIGKYTVSAKEVLPDGSVQPLKVSARWEGGGPTFGSEPAPAPSMTIEFTPAQGVVLACPANHVDLLLSN